MTNHSHSHDPSDGCMHLDQTPFDQIERDVLQMARMYFLSFHKPESQAWVNAFYSAEQRFGMPYGATIGNAVLMAVNSMRSARSAGFSYRDPKCPTCREFITNEERYFVSALHDIRQRNRSGAKMNAMLLCQGADDQQFLDCMGRLAVLITENQAFGISTSTPDRKRAKA